jgi:hypothetical protein
MPWHCVTTNSINRSMATHEHRRQPVHQQSYIQESKLKDKEEKKRTEGSCIREAITCPAKSRCRNTMYIA